MTGPRYTLLDKFLKAANANKPLETTVLTPGQEAVFRIWARENGIENPDDPRGYYDYRGAFKAQAMPEVSPVDNQPHWTDIFKQHGHPTFSVESKYSSGPRDGGRWGGPDGETFTAPTRADSLSMLRMLMSRTKKRTP